MTCWAIFDCFWPLKLIKNFQTHHILINKILYYFLLSELNLDFNFIYLGKKILSRFCDCQFFFKMFFNCISRKSKFHIFCFIFTCLLLIVVANQRIFRIILRIETNRELHKSIPIIYLDLDESIRNKTNSGIFFSFLKLSFILIQCF